MKINKNLISRNHTALKRTKKDIEYIIVHYVGALGDAKANTDYYKSNDVGASADFFVGFSGDRWQANDYYNYYSWHCGGGLQGSGGHAFYGKCTNKNSIGIEMCVRKRSTKTMNATDKDWYFEDATVKATAELVAKLMKELNIDIDHVIRHYDVNGKICPNPFVYDTGKVTWKEFKSMVKTAYNGGTAEKEPEEKKGMQASELKGLSEEEAIAKVAPLYTDSMKKTGLLASVGIAQFCLESGYGQTDLAQGANNMHGMKCILSGNTWSGSVWDGESKYTKITKEEYTPGVITDVKADFRKYPCIEDSIADRAAYFTNAKNGSKLRYSGLVGETDYKKAITIIKNGGYATDSKYISKLCSIVEKYKLTQYDVKSPENGSTPSASEKNLYRVRKNWNDASTQIGAYESLENAKKACKPGYTVYDKSGKKVYANVSGTESFKPYMVKVTSKKLRIRDAADGSWTGKYTGVGTFTIVEEKKTSTHTWGLLKAYQKNRSGWIALDVSGVKKV